jgi:hypothetical protein
MKVKRIRKKPFTALGAKRKRQAYERARVAWRRDHPHGPVSVTEKTHERSPGSDS